ncbi:hypothetical protein WQ54_11635 [Bacillus sp. SA1-12]|nr:hypothetical protein WQ54_11635 [Bacillus sp. SA1-12]
MHDRHYIVLQYQLTKEATVGDKVKISADVKNNVKGIRNVSVYYKNINESHGKEIALNYNSITKI